MVSNSFFHKIYLRKICNKSNRYFLPSTIDYFLRIYVRSEFKMSYRVICGLSNL